MKLIPVDPTNEQHVKVLCDLLAERTPEQSISHKRMPTWEEHVEFVKSKTPGGREYNPDAEPYDMWDLIIADDGQIVGSVYVTEHSEIGVSVFRSQQRKGYGSSAVQQMMGLYDGTRYANISPANEPSRKMFEKLGFKLIQHTYSLEAGEHRWHGGWARVPPLRRGGPFSQPEAKANEDRLTAVESGAEKRVTDLLNERFDQVMVALDGLKKP